MSTAEFDEGAAGAELDDEPDEVDVEEVPPLDDDADDLEDDVDDDVDDTVDDDVDIVVDDDDDDDDADDTVDEDDEAEESLDVLLAREKVLDEDDLGRIAEESRDVLDVRPALVGAGEFTCRSCFLVKRRAQLANEKRLFCFDCA